MNTLLSQSEILVNDLGVDSIQAFLMGKADSHILNGKQCRGARAMLKWSVRESAKNAGVGTATVVRIERDSTDPRPNPASLAALRLAFERAGVIFIGEDGVRLPTEDGDTLTQM
jgi:transcriptional regulator with XRE-family HTH domain